mgnify:CR=1 FL=1
MGRGHHYAVPGMNARGVEVFHIANHYTAVFPIPYDFELYFLPSQEGAFKKDLG